MWSADVRPRRYHRAVTASFPPVALPAHPYAAALQAYCLSFEGAYEDYPWGDIVYKVANKMFATLGAIEGGVATTVKAAPEEAEFLSQLPHIERAAYIGRYGWVRISITDEGTLDHARELIAGSYALVASKAPRRRSRKTP